jgi:hypothetical protein
VPSPWNGGGCGGHPPPSVGRASTRAPFPRDYNPRTPSRPPTHPSFALETRVLIVDSGIKSPETVPPCPYPGLLYGPLLPLSRTVSTHRVGLAPLFPFLPVADGDVG